MAKAATNNLPHPALDASRRDPTLPHHCANCACAYTIVQVRNGVQFIEVSSGIEHTGDRCRERCRQQAESTAETVTTEGRRHMPPPYEAPPAGHCRYFCAFCGHVEAKDTLGRKPADGSSCRQCGGLMVQDHGHRCECGAIGVKFGRSMVPRCGPCATALNDSLKGGGQNDTPLKPAPAMAPVVRQEATPLPTTAPVADDCFAGNCGRCRTCTAREPDLFDHAMNAGLLDERPPEPKPDRPAYWRPWEQQAASPPCDFAPPPAPTAQQTKADAIAQVDANTDLEWKVAALTAIRRIAKRQATLTSDDVWREVGKPPEPRALGAVMQRAARAGIITKSDRVVPSTRPETHANPKAVWHSTRYVEQEIPT